MDNNIAVKFTNVTKEYILFKNDKQRFKALFFSNERLTKVTSVDNMSFEIKKGEAIALLGRNGAGKSTTLKLITSVINPTSGEIEVNGRVSAMLELTAGFDPDFTGRENIYFRCSVMGLTKKQIEKIEQQIIDFADIGIYIDQPLRTYSTGMKARLGFAINSNVSPDILIIDEALSVGDQEFQRKCRNKVKEVLAKGDVTLLFVTHATSSARAFCESGMVIDKGKIIYRDNIENAISYYEKMVEGA